MIRIIKANLVDHYDQVVNLILIRFPTINFTFNTPTSVETFQNVIMISKAGLVAITTE